MQVSLKRIVDTEKYPLGEPGFRARCRDTLNAEGALVLPGFLRPEAVEAIRREGEAHRHGVYYCTKEHNVYVTPPDPAFPADHPRNRIVTSSLGCITDDIVPPDSHLRFLYDAPVFREFLRTVLGETALHEYADPLSSVNLNYTEPGQELGWHFDNSSFAITLMIQESERGGAFEYIEAMRDADRGEMNFAGVERVLDGDIEAKRLVLGAGALALFRGRDAIHRVAPVEGRLTRMLAVLAYNSQPGIALSESSRMTFYGRLG